MTAKQRLILILSIAGIAVLSAALVEIARLDERAPAQTQIPAGSVSTPASGMAPTSTEPVFPKDLINKPLTVNDEWIAPVLLVKKDSCVSRSEDLGGERWDRTCPAYAEAAVSKGVTAEVVPFVDFDSQDAPAQLRFLENGKELPIPRLNFFLEDTNIAVSYVDRFTIHVELYGYETIAKSDLDSINWMKTEIPSSVLAAYPWNEKPPFNVTLGKRYTKYTETRFPPGELGYYGNDPDRSKWALVYIVDRSTGKLVDRTAAPRQAD